MDKMSNFKKAYSELASMVGIEGTADAPASPLPEPPAPKEYMAPEQDFPTMGSISPIGVTTIASDSIFNGDITAGNLEIFGTVNGTVIASGSVLIRGNVIGNITASSILLEGCTIQADLITASGNLEISEGSSVISNVHCTNLSLHARVKGDLTISDGCTLHSSAAVEGNLTARSISIMSGAAIKGMIDVTG